MRVSCRGRQLVDVKLESVLANEDARALLGNVKTLDLGQNEIAHVSGLQEFSSLTALDLSENKLTSLKGLPLGLIRLQAFKNQLSSLDGLAPLAIVQEVDVSYNRISDIRGLPRASPITVLRMSHNRLSHTNGLEQLVHLQVLDLDQNYICLTEDIRSLSQCKNLTNLSLRGNPCSEHAGYRVSIAHIVPPLISLDGQLVPKNRPQKPSSPWRGRGAGAVGQQAHGPSFATKSPRKSAQGRPSTPPSIRSKATAGDTSGRPARNSMAFGKPGPAHAGSGVQRRGTSAHARQRGENTEHGSSPGAAGQHQYYKEEGSSSSFGAFRALGELMDGDDFNALLRRRQQQQIPAEAPGRGPMVVRVGDQSEAYAAQGDTERGDYLSPTDTTQARVSDLLRRGRIAPPGASDPPPPPSPSANPPPPPVDPDATNQARALNMSFESVRTRADHTKKTLHLQQKGHEASAADLRRLLDDEYKLTATLQKQRKKLETELSETRRVLASELSKLSTLKGENAKLIREVDEAKVKGEKHQRDYKYAHAKVFDAKTKHQQEIEATKTAHRAEVIELQNRVKSLEREVKKANAQQTTQQSGNVTGSTSNGGPPSAYDTERAKLLEYVQLVEEQNNQLSRQVNTLQADLSIQVRRHEQGGDESQIVPTEVVNTGIDDSAQW
eukprot:gene2352-3648_t